MAFAFPVILHISRLCQQHNISSLADLISLKYQHSHLIAALITLLCFFGVVPYIALQLDAITKSINLLTGEPQTTTPWLSIYVAGLLAIFAITFGTRTLNLTDKHPGLLLTIAFESIIKLVALWAVGIFVCFFLFDGALDLISNAASNDSARDVIYADSAPWVYLSHVALGVCSMFVLPRQFHMNFVEQNGEGELRTARWLFPLYLFGMTLFIIPIALAGKMLLPVGTSSDAYVLALPLHTENIALSSFAFIGGLSATTSMVIVATLAMGIMISNNVVTPLWLKARLKTSPNQSMQPSKILSIRRITVVVVLSIALWYHLNISQAAPLVKSGVIAIALLAQCMPVLMFGIYWRRSSKAAAVSALLVGSTCWAIFLLYPSLLSSYYFNPAPTDQALGLGFAFSLLANCITFVVVAFISSRHGTNETDTTLQSNSPPNLLVKVRDLMALTERVLESATHSQLVKQLTIDVERASSSGYASQALIDRVNKLLAAQVGAPSARILLGAIADTGRAALPELVDWVEEATQSFQFNHEVLQSSVQNIEQGISVVDDKLQLLAWNDRYVELFAYPKGFLKAGMPITDILSYNAKRGLFNPSSIDKRVSYMREGTRHKHIRKQPDGKVIELNGAPLPGGGYVTTYSDITEYMAIQKELESAKEDLEERVAQRTAELEEAKLQADKANESKTKFLAAAGHDLMQPFNAATLFASMLSKKTQGSELATLSEGVVNSLDNAQSLLSMLLDMTKLDAGVLIPQKTEFAIDEMLSSLVQEFSVIAKQKGVTLRYVQTNVMVYSDKNLLRRVLQNLLSNAVRYTPKGSILVGVRRIQTANTEKKIKLCVYDTGLGIAAHQQHEIFSEFHQLDNNKGEGIGLGLTIVEKICRLLGHQVGLTSLPGKGSCFSVTATRIMHTSGNSKQVLKTESYNKELFLENKRFLLVENDEQVANAMCALLADWGANTTLITSGTEAHNVSHQHFDVLIADYHLNYGENGFDVAAILSEENVSFALKILVTANRSNEIREKAAASQFSYLPKPLKPAALKRLLKQTLPHHH